MQNSPFAQIDDIKSLRGNMEADFRFVPLKIILFPETQNDNIKTHLPKEKKKKILIAQTNSNSIKMTSGKV